MLHTWRRHLCRQSKSPRLYRLQLEALEARDLPAPLTWAVGAGLPAARGGIVAAVQGSNILVLGGTTTDVTSVSAGDPTWKGTVSADPSVEAARESPGVGILPDGFVLLFGGRGNGAAFDSATHYDYAGNPDNDIPYNSGAAHLHASRVQFGYATDANNLIYAIGGIGANSNGGDGGGGPDAPLSSVEYYTQSTDTWTSVASLPQTLYSEAAISDGSGHLFTFGGVDATGNITSTVYRYTISTNTWDTVASLPIAVRDSAAVLANGKIYVMGGRTATGATADVESYNETTNTWTTETSLPAPVSSAAAAVDSLGRIEVLGGFDANGKPTAAVSISQELSNPDAAPSITSVANTAASWGNLYHYQVLSTGNPQATYSLTTAPSGMTVNSSTGLISWTPSSSQLGSFSVTVQAGNFAGNTSQSYTVTVSNPKPTIPTGFGVIAEGDDSILLSWNASTDPSGGLSYGVYKVTGGAHHTTVYTLMGTTTNTSITLTKLTVGISYLLDVKATDGAGRSSGYSISQYAQTYDRPALYSPIGTSINVTAKQPFTDDLGALGANLTYKMVTPALGNMQINATTGVVTWTPRDIDVGSNASAIFTASNSKGTSPQLVLHFTVAANLPVIQYTSPDLVGGTLYATLNSAFSMNLSDSFSHSAITWAILGSPSGLTINSSTGVVSWTPSSGTDLGPYTVTIQATNYAGSVSVTIPLTLTFATAPGSFKASNLNPTAGTADLTWSAPTSSAQTISSYQITVTYTDASGATHTNTIIVAGTSTKHTLTGLAKGTTYTVSIAALDAIGDLGIPSLLTFSL
jgi:N-acetylneuraminic acid mutarotase